MYYWPYCDQYFHPLKFEKACYSIVLDSFFFSTLPLRLFYGYFEQQDIDTALPIEDVLKARYIWEWRSLSYLRTLIGW